jgi:hypothetical protein
LKEAAPLNSCALQAVGLLPVPLVRIPGAAVACGFPRTPQVSMMLNKNLNAVQQKFCNAKNEKSFRLAKKGFVDILNDVVK